MEKLIFTFLLIGVLLIGGCVGEGATDTINDNFITKEQVTTTKQPSELILELSDLPSNYSIKEKAPRLKSDISEEANNLGWKSGYFVTYVRVGENLFDMSGISQWISVYPIENVSKVLDIPHESENYTYEELPNPNIGDDSRAYRITVTDGFLVKRFYEINFIKMNIYEGLQMTGTATDYELLKTLAKKAEKKIS